MYGQALRLRGRGVYSVAACDATIQACHNMSCLSIWCTWFLSSSCVYLSGRRLVCTCRVPLHQVCTADLRTKTLDFRGFDSCIYNLYFKGWNSHVHRGIPGNVESTNLSREILSREIKRIGDCRAGDNNNNSNDNSNISNDIVLIVIIAITVIP